MSAVGLGPDYPPQPRFAGLSGRAPNGVVELWLVRDLPGAVDSIGTALVDPWTGRGLGFALQCPDDACPEDWATDPTRPAASAVPSVAPSAVPVGDLSGDGCAPATAAEIAALGLSTEFGRFPALSSTPLAAGRSRVEIGLPRARASGLGLVLPALPDGLGVRRIDAQRPIHAVRYILTTGPLGHIHVLPERPR